MAPAIIDDRLTALLAPIAAQPVEIGVLLYVDGSGRLAGMRHLRGRREGIAIPLRLIVADALAFDARHAIMAHNHPSGDCAASRDDITLTRRIARALEMVGIGLVDHVIVASGGRSSLRAEGRL